jgi:ATP-dependent DNA ligase
VELRPPQLNERKANLARSLAGSAVGIVFNEHTDEDGPTVFRQACKLGFEGTVSKRLGGALPVRAAGTRARLRRDGLTPAC